MSATYHLVTSPETEDVITARMWNDQFIGNWDYLAQMTIGNRQVGGIIPGALDMVGAEVWINGAVMYQNFMEVTFDITYPAKARYLRLIAGPLRSNRSVSYDYVCLFFNDDRATNYDGFMRYEPGVDIFNYEFFGLAGWVCGIVPGTTYGTGLASMIDLTIFLPNYDGADDYPMMAGRCMGNGKTSASFFSDYLFGRWQNGDAITTITFGTYWGTEYQVGFGDAPDFTRIDIYALLGG